MLLQPKARSSIINSRDVVGLFCSMIVHVASGKKSLKIPKGYSESVNRQHNGQKKKYKRTNNDLQNVTHKTKDRVTRTHY